MNIAVKIITFIITSGIVGVVSVFLFGFMLLAMNGFNEADATYGIYLYMIWAGIGSVLAGGLGILAVHFLANKYKIHIAVAGLISTVVFLIIGVIINIVGVVAGIIMAEIVRTQF